MAETKIIVASGQEPLPTSSAFTLEAGVSLEALGLLSLLSSYPSDCPISDDELLTHINRGAQAARPIRKADLQQMLEVLRFAGYLEYREDRL